MLALSQLETVTFDRVGTRGVAWFRSLCHRYTHSYMQAKPPWRARGKAFAALFCVFWPGGTWSGLKNLSWTDVRTDVLVGIRVVSSPDRTVSRSSRRRFAVDHAADEFYHQIHA